MPIQKNILVIGGGAIGGVVAAVLVKNNMDISLLVKYPSLKKMVKNEGLSVRGFKGEFNRKVEAYLPSDLLSEKFNYVLIATKAPEMEDAARHILPFTHDNTLFVSLQNGICEDDLAEIVGKERTVGCVVGWGATMLQPGKYDMTSGGEFLIGYLENKPDERLNELKNILEQVVPTSISDNIYGALFSKLIINSCITTMGAISGVVLGKMLKKRQYRNIFRAIMKESILVANAMKIKVEPFARKIDFYKITKDGFFNAIRQHLIIRIIGMKYRRLKSSSLQSLERGKATEIDWFNGYIVKKAKEYNIPAPVNQKIVDLVKEIESGRRKTGLNNIQSNFLKDLNY